MTVETEGEKAASSLVSPPAVSLTCWERQTTSPPPPPPLFSSQAISHELWCCYHHSQLSGRKAGSASLTVVSEQQVLDHSF